jgi:hypothetical protein
MQKMEGVTEPASDGTEFMLEGMQACGSGEANACPLTLVFRYGPQDLAGTPVNPLCMSQVKRSIHYGLRRCDHGCLAKACACTWKTQTLLKQVAI